MSDVSKENIMLAACVTIVVLAITGAFFLGHIAQYIEGYAAFEDDGVLSYCYGPACEVCK